MCREDMAISLGKLLTLAASISVIALSVHCDEFQRCRGLGGHYGHHGHHHNNHHPCGNHSETFTCGQSTSDKISYFVNPRNVPMYCTFRVAATNSRVTQLRLDFESFSLEQPQNAGSSPAENRFPAYICNKDTFYVSSLSTRGSKNLGFTNLCGENTGQHIYIPVNSGSPTDLIFNLADRSDSNSALIQPNWRIKVTQLDCTSPNSKDECAPAGCLQYYTDRTGQFESFNYNNGVGHYQGLLNYAICFKRYDGVCSIRYDPTGFQLAANNLGSPYGTDGCNQVTTNPAGPSSQDYLYVPDAQTGGGVKASLFCGDILQKTPASTNAPGPMYMYFRTDSVADPIALGDEIGFRIKYSEEGTGCYGTNSYPGIKG